MTIEEHQGDDSSAAVTRLDVQRLRREARARDVPSAEEQAFQEGWDACAAAELVETGRRRKAPFINGPLPQRQQRPQRAPAERPNVLHRWREMKRRAYMLSGYPPPKARGRR